MQTIVVAVVVRDGRTLLVRRRGEGELSWQFPAGEQEPGETPEQTAVREVAEEVALIVRPVARLGERRHPLTRRHVIYVACDADTADEAQLVDTVELDELRWCDGPELAQRIPTGLFEPVVAYLRARLAPPVEL